MVTALQPARPLYDPVDGVPAAVERTAWLWPLLLLMACVCLSSVAFFLRWDASSTVVGELTMSGELARSTEQEVVDKIQTAERAALVGGVAKGVFLEPLIVLLVAAVLKFTAWLFGVKAPFVKCFAAVAIALVPIALYHAIFAASAFAQVGLTTEGAKALVPSHLGQLFTVQNPGLQRALTAVDFFNLWSAVLLGLGFAQASGMRRHRAVILGVVLYAMYAGLFMIGLPGMSGGPGGHQ